MQNKKQFITIWILFAIYVVIRIMFKIQYSFILSLITCSLSIMLLKNCGMPSKKNIYISIVFALLSTIAYLGYQMNPKVLLYGLTSGIPTLICSLAVFSVMERKMDYALISKKGKYTLAISIVIAIVVGLILSGINILLSGQEIHFNFSILKLLVCLNPAIYEEIACRAIFMAYCIWYAEEKMDTFQKFTMYFMMCIPHSMAHGYPFMTTIILSLLFGLPFALLQRKRDLTSAMISHGIVDAIRFTLIGM